MELQSVFPREDPPIDSQLGQKRLSISILDSLKSFPAKRAVIYSVCTLILGTIITIFHMSIRFLTDLSTNDRVWEYLAERSRAFQNMSQQLAEMDDISSHLIRLLSNSTLAKNPPYED